MRTASNSEVRQPLVKAEGLVKVFGDFWMRAKARAEQTATSGANQGGKTATFLMETQAVLTAESSSVLIEDLQRSMPINRVIEPIVKADQAKKKAEPDFFGELLTPTPSVQHVKPPSPPEPTEAIDRSVIDGLIDGDSKKKG